MSADGINEPETIKRILDECRTIAVVGLSSDAWRPSHGVAAYMQRTGRRVIPVNPNETEVEGLAAYRTILDVPERPKMVSLYVPPPVVLKILPDIAAKGCDELWMNPGTESDEALAEAERLGLNVIQACSIIAVGAFPGAF